MRAVVQTKSFPVPVEKADNPRSAPPSDMLVPITASGDPGSVREEPVFARELPRDRTLRPREFRHSLEASRHICDSESGG